MWSRSGQRQHNRATKRKGNKIKPSLQQQPVKMLFVTEGARREVNKEYEEADEDPHSEVVVRPTLRQIPFRSLSLIKLPMLPKHDGTFFLTSTYRQYWWKRAKGERNVSYCWFSFFVLSVKMVKPFLRWGYSWPFLQLTLVHVMLLLILITESQSWQPAFPHSFRNHDSGLDMTWLPSPIRLLELSGVTSSHKIFEFNLFNPYRSAVHSTMAEERRIWKWHRDDRRLRGMEHKSFEFFYFQD